MKFVTGFHHGFKHALVGFQFLKSNPSLVKWTIAPFLIGLIIIALFLGLGVGLISEWVAAALAFAGLTGAGFFIGVLEFFVGLLLWLVYLIIVVYGTFLLTLIISAPFNSLLAERSLMLAGALKERPFQLFRWIRISVKMLALGVIKSLVFLLFGVVIFVCSFIPVLNIVSSYCAFLIMSFDSMDYSFEIMEMNLSQRFGFFQRHFSEFAGMAAFLSLTILVPGITLLILPFSVIGAAVTMSEIQRGKK